MKRMAATDDETIISMSLKTTVQGFLDFMADILKKGVSVELMDGEEIILNEIALSDLGLGEIAETYAILSRQTATGKPEFQYDWLKVNNAIVKRWGLEGLENVKRLAMAMKAIKR